MRCLLAFIHFAVLARSATFAGVDEIPLNIQTQDKLATSSVSDSDRITTITGSTSVLLQLNEPAAPENCVIALEYFCIGNVQTQVTFAPSPADTPEVLKLPRFHHREVLSRWNWKLPPESAWLAAAAVLRIDFQLEPGARLEIRNPRLRRAIAGEFDVSGHLSKHAANSEAIADYLSAHFDCSINEVRVLKDELEITGHVNRQQAGIMVGEIPMEALLTDTRPWQSLTEIAPNPDGSFVATMPRFTNVDGGPWDRFLSRWQLVQIDNDKTIPLSHAHYADEVFCRNSDLPELIPATRKGLGGWSVQREPELNDELKTLGISAVTVNVNAPQRFVSTQPQPGWDSFRWQGQTYYANEQRLKQLDRTFVEAEKNGVMVSAILLITNPTKSGDADAKLLAHPDATPDGIFAMPNVTSTAGLNYYGAILNFMAARWSERGGIHGRVHHWIMHNEVDFGWTWTNAGRKSDLQYMDLYQRSMRLASLITRQHNPHARVWISLTHHWNETGTGDGYGSRRMLELLADFCRTEGDFPWALAYHPYPQSLFEPKTWLDNQATPSFDARKITPRNLHVLDEWMQQPMMKYRGALRPVHLSENGFNSRNYTAQALNDQAAGMAYAWIQMKPLKTIKMWHYHNWIDNRHEGGLKIGLRKFRDDSMAPLEPKPIWHLYKSLATDAESDALAAYRDHFKQ